MNKRVMYVTIAAAALAGLPMLSPAAEPSMQGCVRALMSQLSATSSMPVKLVREETEVSTGMPLMSTHNELLLTARDARSDRTLMRMVCTTDDRGHLVLQQAPPAAF